MMDSLRPAFFLALAVLPLVTCLEPTEVRVTILSDICEKLDVSISVDDKPPSAQKTFPPACGSNLKRLGEIVFVPGNTKQRRFTFHVRGAAPGGDCTTGARCVSASRNITYIDHTKLDVAVELTSDCIGVSCGVGKTCKRGVCVSDVVDCTGPNCALDGGVVDAADEPIVSDVADVGSACVPPTHSLFSYPPTFRWAFDATNKQITEQNFNISVPLGVNVTTSSANMAFGCGEALAIDGVQPLGVVSKTNGVGIATYVFVGATPGSANFLLKKKMAGNEGIFIFVDYQRIVWIQTCGAQTCSDSKYPPLDPNRWVSFEAEIGSMSKKIKVAYDGVLQNPTLMYVDPGAFGTGDLEVGDGKNVRMDELSVYDVD